MLKELQKNDCFYFTTFWAFPTCFIHHKPSVKVVCMTLNKVIQFSASLSFYKASSLHAIYSCTLLFLVVSLHCYSTAGLGFFLTLHRFTHRTTELVFVTCVGHCNSFNNKNKLIFWPFLAVEHNCQRERWEKSSEGSNLDLLSTNQEMKNTLSAFDLWNAVSKSPWICL